MFGFWLVFILVWAVPAICTVINLSKKRFRFMAPVIFSAIGIGLFLWGAFSSSNESGLIAKIKDACSGEGIMGLIFIAPLFLSPPLTLLVVWIVKKMQSVINRHKENQLRRRFHMSPEDMEESRAIQDLRD